MEDTFYFLASPGVAISNSQYPLELLADSSPRRLDSGAMMAGRREQTGVCYGACCVLCSGMPREGPRPRDT